MYHIYTSRLTAHATLAMVQGSLTILTCAMKRFMLTLNTYRLCKLNHTAHIYGRMFQHSSNQLDAMYNYGGVQNVQPSNQLHNHH